MTAEINLRNLLAFAIHDATCECQRVSIMNDAHDDDYDTADAILPVVRAYADAAVAAEREHIAHAIDAAVVAIGEEEFDVPTDSFELGLKTAAAIARGGTP